MNKAVTAPLPASVLEALARYDTPTICNAMEIVAPERRLIGYTTKPLVCPFPDLPPMVGYARTVTIRSVLKSGLPAEEQSKRRIDYYEYVGTGDGPRITVIQDIDGPDVGYGAFWGEVQSNVHKALGCLGVITDGSIRDIEVEETSKNEVFDQAAVRAVRYSNPLPPLPKEFQESELHVHIRFTVKR